MFKIITSIFVNGTWRTRNLDHNETKACRVDMYIHLDLYGYRNGFVTAVGIFRNDKYYIM